MSPHPDPEKPCQPALASRRVDAPLATRGRGASVLAGTTLNASAVAVSRSGSATVIHGPLADAVIADGGMGAGVGAAATGEGAVGIGVGTLAGSRRRISSYSRSVAREELRLSDPGWLTNL